MLNKEQTEGIEVITVLIQHVPLFSSNFGRAHLSNRGSDEVPVTIAITKAGDASSVGRRYEIKYDRC